MSVFTPKAGSHAIERDASNTRPTTRKNIRVAAGETIVVAVLAFLIPFILEGPQLLVGSLVNAALVYAALNVSAGRALPVVFMPSIAALSRGALFGALTPYLAIMLPVIWAGNVLLVYSIKMAAARSVPLWISLPGAAALKAGVIFLFAFLMVQVDVLPPAMVSAMGIVQLATALIGAAIAVGATGIVNRLISVNE